MAAALFGTGVRAARSKSATVDWETRAAAASSCWDQARRARAALTWAGVMSFGMRSAKFYDLIMNYRRRRVNLGTAQGRIPKVSLSVPLPSVE